MWESVRRTWETCHFLLGQITCLCRPLGASACSSVGWVHKLLPVLLALKIPAFYTELVGTQFNLNCPGRDHPYLSPLLSVIDILIRNTWPSSSLTLGERGICHYLGRLDSCWEGPVCYQGNVTGWPTCSAVLLVAPEEVAKCIWGLTGHNLFHLLT